MILKTFELKKIKLDSYRFFLIYGNNKGFVEEIIENNLKPILFKDIYNYDENEILQNSDNFKEDILSRSFFDDKKLIIISRVTDKIFKIIEEIISKNIKDISIILKASTLEKKSKIRNFFEKQNETVCIPVYEDNYQTLNIIIKDFLNKNKIILSQEIINIVIERARGDRINLKNELDKLKYFYTDKKKIELEHILNLTNLAENHNISELVDSSLAQNKKKTLYILNENNFASDDCIQIVRIYLSKLKRLLNIKSETTKNNNIEQVISSYKPPIFWKEKDIVKQQVKIWNSKKIENLIMDTNELEYQIKKNPNSSTLLVTNFILEKTLETNNSL